MLCTFDTILQRQLFYILSSLRLWFKFITIFAKGTNLFEDRGTEISFTNAKIISRAIDIKPYTKERSITCRMGCVLKKWYCLKRFLKNVNANLYPYSQNMVWSMTDYFYRWCLIVTIVVLWRYALSCRTSNNLTCYTLVRKSFIDPRSLDSHFNHRKH